MHAPAASPAAHFSKHDCLVKITADLFVTSGSASLLLRAYLVLCDDFNNSFLLDTSHESLKEAAPNPLRQSSKPVQPVQVSSSWPQMKTTPCFLWQENAPEMDAKNQSHVSTGCRSRIQRPFALFSSAAGAEVRMLMQMQEDWHMQISVTSRRRAKRARIQVSTLFRLCVMFRSVSTGTLQVARRLFSTRLPGCT